MRRRVLVRYGGHYEPQAHGNVLAAIALTLACSAIQRHHHICYLQRPNRRSIAHTNVSNFAKITVNVPPDGMKLGQSLPNGTTGAAYSQTISVTGGTPPFTWSLSSGALPTGLELGSSTGTISGTPTAAGTFNFVLLATDADGFSVSSGNLSITITSSGASGNPLPFLEQPLLPSSTAPGSSAFTLTVNGFTSTHQLSRPRSSPLTNSPRAVPAANVASAGTAAISVANSPTGVRSNVVYFAIATAEASANFTNASGSPITAASSPSSIKAGDFNGDGKPDLAVISRTNLSPVASFVSVLLGNGDGTFTAASGSPISFGTLPLNDLALGDFNNDGKIDIALAGGPGNAIMAGNVPILVGKGNGTFALSPSPGSTNSYGMCCMAVGDFNRDGNLDLRSQWQHGRWSSRLAGRG